MYTFQDWTRESQMEPMLENFQQKEGLDTDVFCMLCFCIVPNPA